MKWKCHIPHEGYKVRTDENKETDTNKLLTRDQNIRMVTWYDPTQLLAPFFPLIRSNDTLNERERELMESRVIKTVAKVLNMQICDVHRRN